MTTNNPLLFLGDPISFDQIRGEHVESAVREVLAEAQAKLDALVATPQGGRRTFDNTLVALDDVTDRLERVMGVVSHLESVATTPSLRAAYSAVDPLVSAFYTSITLSEPVYAALKAFAATDEARALVGPRRRFLEKTMADFKRNGAELPIEGKRRLSDISVELATLTLRFSQNVLDSTNAFEVVVTDEARLSGLPEQARAAARESAAKKGLPGFRFTLQAPVYIPVLTYADDRALREELYRAHATRATGGVGAGASPGASDNRPIVARILELRRERATLLGFATFADLVLDDRMAKNGATARRFLEVLRERTEPFFLRENLDLLAFRRELEGAAAPELEPWDVAYYAEKLRRARFDVDEEALRPYFSLEAVLQGIFETARRLYGIAIEPWADAPVWHPSVRAFLLREPDGTNSAAFYVDVAPREDKRDGAWMHSLLTAKLREGSDLLDGRHVEVLAGNLTPGVGEGPALLTHREVETMFHEWGHLLHHASSRVPIRSQAGTAVAWDFVELPSQIMENWCWEREALDLFARHHASGELLPSELLERMRAARTFRAANAMMRQLSFADLDLSLHMEYSPAAHGDLMAYSRAVLGRYSPVPLPAYHAMIASFGHLFSSPVGYAAGYYSYKWAEVLDADAFTRFRQGGLFSPEVGAAFRSRVLAKGDSEDPMELFRAFVGREPTIDALLTRAGLLGSPAEASGRTP